MYCWPSKLVLLAGNFAEYKVRHSFGYLPSQTCITMMVIIFRLMVYTEGTIGSVLGHSGQRNLTKHKDFTYILVKL